MKQTGKLIKEHDDMIMQLEEITKLNYINALNPPVPLSPILETDSDIAIKINTMFQMGKNVEIPFGIYNLNSKISMPLETSLFGNATLKSTSINGYIDYNTNCRIQNLKFKGQTSSGFKAILVNDNQPVDITNISIDGYDIGIDGISITASKHDGGIIANSRFINNNIGISAGQYFEYVNIIGNSFKGNGTGVKIIGGNINVSNNYMCDNAIGIEILSGLNGSHGVICGNQINHNTKSISLIGVPNGFTISGNNIFYGTLEIKNCTDGAITIVGNTLSCDWVFDNSEIVLGNNYFNQNGITFNKVSVTDTAVVSAGNNMMDKRSIEFMDNKYRTENRSLKVTSDISSDTPLALNNFTILNMNNAEWLKYFGNIRKMNIASLITSNGEYITTTSTSKGDVQIQCKIDLILDSTYTESIFPTLFFTSVNGDTYIIPQVNRGQQADNSRIVSYVGAIAFPHQSGATNKITLNILASQVGLASKIKVRKGSSFIINGV